ncbi:SH3 domain-containing protein [Chelatococcus sp.]|uniref:SH3 domain-containing protein n=1 Tax=Chelatococcus sp. TaxID=1953771 RepID=UPI0034139F48|nr:SH3 domain-containing protein [Chelatococcus sp.]
MAAHDVLNIRQEPSAKARIIGTIPSNARRLMVLGGRGVASFGDWSRMTPSERRAAAARRWCQIEFDGRRGWVSDRLLSE